MYGIINNIVITMHVLKFGRESMDNEAYLEQLEIGLLKENISDFWNIDFENASSEKIGNLYMKCFTQDKFKEIPINYYGIYIDCGLKLYRIRKDIKDYSELKSLQDFSYNPNPSIRTIGRFNKDMDKILYLSTDISTTLKEMNVEIGEKFILIEYKVVKEIPVRPVNISNWYGTNNSENGEKVKILNDFVNQIMRISTEQNSSSYKITTLLKDYFPFSLFDEVVGWFYKSIKDDGNNLALTYPKASGFLKLSDFKMVEIRPDEKMYMLSNYKVQQWIKKIIESEVII